MAEVSQEVIRAEEPDISHIITEDDTPVDNIFSEMQQRLLTRSLNCSWQPGRPFIAAANVGVFYALRQPPIIPDMFLSMDVKKAEDLWEKKNRSYFLWEFGKPPEVAVEIVSNRKGGEARCKMRIYEQIGVLYYIIFDPQLMTQKEELRIYELSVGQYLPKIDRQLTRLGLIVTLWEGEFEGSDARWLRWSDRDGKLIKTGEERVEMAEQKEELALKRAERLAAKLHSLGIKYLAENEKG